MQWHMDLTVAETQLNVNILDYSINGTKLYDVNEIILNYRDTMKYQYIALHYYAGHEQHTMKHHYVSLNDSAVHEQHFHGPCKLQVKQINDYFWKICGQKTLYN